MNITTEGTGDTLVLRIEGALLVSGVAALKARMLSDLQTCRTLVLDLAGIGECDTAGLQLVCGACRKMLDDGRRIMLGKTSPAIQSMADRLGLTLPATIEAHKE